MTSFGLRPAQPIVAVGDVHGMSDMLRDVLAEADAAQAFPVLLGDLIDKGPDSVGVLRMVLPRLLSGTMGLVRGNHDERLLRNLTQGDGKKTRALAEIKAVADADEICASAIRALTAAPYWISLRRHVLVHGAFHPDMIAHASRGLAAGVPGHLRALALFGETDGRFDAVGNPIRTYGWIDRIPPGLTVLAGHDTRQKHEPLVLTGAEGGRAIFLDTGAAKGGRLSTWTIPPELPV